MSDCTHYIRPAGHTCIFAAKTEYLCCIPRVSKNEDVSTFSRNAIRVGANLGESTTVRTPLALRINFTLRAT